MKVIGGFLLILIVAAVVYYFVFYKPANPPAITAPATPTQPPAPAPPPPAPAPGTPPDPLAKAKTSNPYLSSYPPGTLLNDGGTIWIIRADGSRYGFPSPADFQSKTGLSPNSLPSVPHVDSSILSYFPVSSTF